MIRRSWNSRWVIGLAVACMILLIHPRGYTQEDDRSKGFIESSVKGLIANTPTKSKVIADLEKLMIDPFNSEVGRSGMEETQSTPHRIATEYALPNPLKSIDLKNIRVDMSKSGIERPVEAALRFAVIPEDGVEFAKPNRLVSGNSVEADESKRKIQRGFETKIDLVGLANGILPNPKTDPYQAPASRPDVAKYDIESMTKSTLVGPVSDTKFPLPPSNPEADLRTISASDRALTSRPVVSNPYADNPKVAPGKINWHADFEAACLASDLSAKPVLHFQLLGQLDQRFT